MKPLSRRQFGKWAAIAAGSASLSGCAPWEHADPDHELDRWIEEPSASFLEWRVLNRLAFGPRPGDVSRLRSRGIDAWIDEQLHPESIPESPRLTAALARLEALDLDAEEARDRETEWEPDEMIAPLVNKLFKYGKRRPPSPGPVRQQLAQAAVLRATYSSRTLQEVMVEFWSDHFNIDQSKGDCRWLKTPDDALLRENALAPFRDALGASAHSPAMLYYLDNAQNRAAGVGPALNENYARELLELHTLGDTGAYTLDDIKGVARVFSGWSIGDSWSGSNGKFIFKSADHDDGEKIVLGQRIAGGQGALEGEQLLDVLARHPLTAQAITRKLCYRFLADVPAELHARLTQVFLQSDGAIREVLAELFRSDEFRHGTRPRFKRPMEFAISALRTVGVCTSGAGIVPYLESMGHRPFNWAQPDGYPVRPEPWTAGLPARWQFGIDLMQNQIDETWINLDALDRPARGRPAADVCRALSRGLCGTALAGDELSALTSLGDDTRSAVPQWLALLLVSPQFQWC